MYGMNLKCRPDLEKIQMQFSNIKIEKINYYFKDKLLCTISDREKISEIANIITKATIDKSKYNFKSYYFAKFETTDRQNFRIECFEDQFRYNGKRYSVDSNIQELFNKICDK